MFGQKRARCVFSGGVANLGRAAAHQDNRLVTGFLQGAQHHDLDKRPDMKAVGRAVETDIGRNDLLGGALIKAFDVGGLMDVAALRERLDKV